MIYLITDPQRLILDNFVKFYNILDDQQKESFEHRFAHLLHHKEIQGFNGMKITEEVKVLVFGLMTEMTFGLDTYYWHNLTRLLVAPDAIFSNYKNSISFGQSDSSGVMLLTWRNLVRSLAYPEKEFNAATHYIARSLLHEHNNSASPYFIKHPLQLIQFQKDQTTVEFLKSIALPPEIVDNLQYNFPDFYGACMEWFFSRPLQLKNSLPELYNSICKIVNQDPVAILQSNL